MRRHPLPRPACEHAACGLALLSPGDLSWLVACLELPESALPRAAAGRCGRPACGWPGREECVRPAPFRTAPVGSHAQIDATDGVLPVSRLAHCDLRQKDRAAATSR